MIFLMRHGEDDDSRLGGWSDASLCQNGIEQVKKSCERLKDNKYNIEYIFSSDLQRAKETADIVSEYLAIEKQTMETLQAFLKKDFKRNIQGFISHLWIGNSSIQTEKAQCSSITV